MVLVRLYFASIAVGGASAQVIMKPNRRIFIMTTSKKLKAFLLIFRILQDGDKRYTNYLKLEQEDIKSVIEEAGLLKTLMEVLKWQE